MPTQETARPGAVGGSARRVVLLISRDVVGRRVECSPCCSSPVPAERKRVWRRGGVVARGDDAPCASWSSASTHSSGAVDSRPGGVAVGLSQRRCESRSRSRWPSHVHELGRVGFGEAHRSGSVGRAGRAVTRRRTGPEQQAARGHRGQVRGSQTVLHARALELCVAVEGPLAGFSCRSAASVYLRGHTHRVRVHAGQSWARRAARQDARVTSIYGNGFPTGNV